MKGIVRPLVNVTSEFDPDVAKLRPKALDSVTVKYRGSKRVVNCFCDRSIPRSIVPHLKLDHQEIWSEWIRLFVALRGKGLSLKQIMRLFCDSRGSLLFSWSVVGREIPRAVESLDLVYKPPPAEGIISWEPSGFKLERKSVWDFPLRGTWAVHASDYRGNWPPQLVRNLLLRHTEPGDLVIDPFVGGGTTLIESWLLGRKSIGIDINRMAVDTTRYRIAEMKINSANAKDVSLNLEMEPVVLQGDALNLEKIVNRLGLESPTRLLCAHPPYLNSISYGSAKGDLSTIDSPQLFYREFKRFVEAAHHLLEPGSKVACLIGDVRRSPGVEPVGMRVLGSFLKAKFTLLDLIIKTQHNDRSSEFYIGSDSDNLMLAHEYLIVLQR